MLESERHPLTLTLSPKGARGPLTGIYQRIISKSPF